MLWRNNVGVSFDETGRPVRYGLANLTAAMNARYKSSDLIGITPVTITQEMVGKVLGVFTSIETKRETWKFRGTKRDVAQLRWINLIKEYGGIGQFSKGPNDILWLKK